jgi:SAM-dependent methyltransferase
MPEARLRRMTRPRAFWSTERPVGSLLDVTSSDVWDEETAAAYDEDAAEMFEPTVVGPAVDLLARLAGSGRALGFAIGTGRLGVPLRQRGVPVVGIDLSAPMVARLHEKISPSELQVVVGDMATTVVPGLFSLVACFRNAARHLEPGGRFLVELFVPPLRRLPVGQTAVPGTVSESYTGLDTIDVVDQTLTSHHYYRAPSGHVRYDSGNFRYIWPAECDLMAQLAGMELESRFGDWDGSPFTADSEKHVSVWRKQ